MKSNSALLLVEVDIILFCNLFSCCWINIKKSLNYLTTNNIFLDDFFNIID